MQIKEEDAGYIAYISYEIEKWLYEGNDNKAIEIMIERGKKRGRFPKELRFVGAYRDEKYGSSGCAFLDDKVAKIIVGFAGTNYRNGVIEGTKDVVADALRLGVTGMEEGCPYLEEPQKFMDEIKRHEYEVLTVTGHSLGGALAMYMGVYNDIPEIITYNGAPLYVVSLGDKNRIKDKVDSYQGKIYRYVSKSDPLNILSSTADGFYPGGEVVIENTQGHAMSNFIKVYEQK